MEGQKWWKMTLLKVWSPGRSVVGRSLSGRSCFRVEVFPGRSISGSKYFRAEVFSGPKYFLGWSIHRAEVFSGPKLFPGRSCFRAEVVSGQNISGPKWVSGQAVSGPYWVWAKRTKKDTKSPQDVPRVSRGYPLMIQVSPQYIPKLSPKHNQNVPKASKRYAWGISKVSTEHFDHPQDLN